MHWPVTGKGLAVSMAGLAEVRADGSNGARPNATGRHRLRWYASGDRTPVSIRRGGGARSSRHAYLGALWPLVEHRCRHG